MIDMRTLTMRVAVDLGIDHTFVKQILESFIGHVCSGLVHDGKVRIQGLGVLSIQPFKLNRKIRILKGPRAGSMVNVTVHYRAYFKKAHRLRRMLQEEHVMPKTEPEMEKYGVDEGTDQENLEKKAADGCPECGAMPKRQGNILICPKHGTEPFEQGE